MVEVRKAKGDTLEFHKVLMFHPLFHVFYCFQFNLFYCHHYIFLNSFCASLQFYKNLSTSLDDVVWRREDDVQETKWKFWPLVLHAHSFLLSNVIAYIISSIRIWHSYARLCKLEFSLHQKKEKRKWNCINDDLEEKSYI